MDIVLSNISRDWSDILAPDHEEPYNSPPLKSIIEQLGKESTKLCPPNVNIFEFARFTDLNSIKVIIIGQDPYHTPGDAHGLAFSCKTQIPPSLRSIIKCLSKTYDRWDSPKMNKIKTGDLTYWAKQGVLLLNAALTTECGTPRAHHNIWKNYVCNLLIRVCRALGNAPIFLIWGADAKVISDNVHKYTTQRAADEAIIEIKRLYWCHPSPVAQTRLSVELRFVNCPHFKKVNDMLASDGKPTIDWNLIDVIKSGERSV
jgi:uracil-DNA glycosylase